VSGPSRKGRAIALEQVAYGSFPFWDRGYDVLARSPGCRPEWLADVLAACRKFGEAPAAVTPAPCLFALPLASGPWAVVGVGPQGADDRGRPGALAFHALVIDRRDYRKAGSNPFAFAGALRLDWSPGATLGPLAWTVEPPEAPASPPDPRAARVAEALARRSRAAIESDGPVDALAREVWARLPRSTRSRASVATWAFGNANRFDFAAFPRLAGVELDRSYVDPARLDPSTGADPPAPPGRNRRAAAVAGIIGMAVAGLAASALFWRTSGRSGPTPPTPDRPAPATAPPRAGPERLERPGRSRTLAALADLAERFSGFELGEADDPSAWMLRFSDRLRYRGSTLSPADLAGLRLEADPDRGRALAWHEQIRRFADDRPLPGDFARRPLGPQLEALAWSFHLDPSALADEAIPAALAAALSRDAPVRPTPLAARYPPLREYARFLGRLPRAADGP